jgi:L-arabinokinase
VTRQPGDVDPANSLPRVLAAHGPFFDPSQPVSTARAPGRLDVMGGIADYSGSLVLQLPIRAEALAAAQWSAGRPSTVMVRTTDPVAAGGAAEVEVPVGDLVGPYDVVRARLAREPASHWAAYVAGAITVLHRERGIRFERGIRWLLASEVPAGKGVGSSAAIEVAAMRALAGLLGLSIAGRDLALLCQVVENLVVGAPCGVMDQMTAACGIPNSLLALLCQPAELLPPVALPDDVALFGVDSGIRHAVTDADYETVRVGAFMGYRFIADLAGLTAREDRGRVVVEDPEWRGYLANITPAEWESRFRDHVPEQTTGAAFVDRYGATTDAVTTVDPDRVYRVRQPAAHPIYEHDRVQRFRALLENGHSATRVSDDALLRLGELMYRSHESYSACGLGSDGTDALVALVREAGPARGLFGAKITGGGSGGTVAVLARPDSRPAVEDVARRYERATGRAATLID